MAPGIGSLPTRIVPEMSMRAALNRLGLVVVAMAVGGGRVFLCKSQISSIVKQQAKASKHGVVAGSSMMYLLNQLDST